MWKIGEWFEKLPEQMVHSSRELYQSGLPAILDDVFGKIALIQMQIPDENEKSLNYRQRLWYTAAHSIVGSFGNDVGFVIAEPRYSDFNGDSRIKKLHLESIVSLWPQDRKIILAGGTDYCFADTFSCEHFFFDTRYVPNSLRKTQDTAREMKSEASSNNRYQLENKLNDAIASALGYKLAEPNLGLFSLDGGDIVSDEKTVFVGEYTFKNNVFAAYWRAARNAEELVKKLQIDGLDEMIASAIKTSETYRSLVSHISQRAKSHQMRLVPELVKQLGVIDGIGGYIETGKENEAVMDLKSEFEAKLQKYAAGRKIVFLVTGKTMPEHIDTFLTPLGNGIVLLGDYKLAKDAVMRQYGYGDGEEWPGKERIAHANEIYMEGIEAVKELIPPDYHVGRVPFSRGVWWMYGLCAHIPLNNAHVEHFKEGGAIVKRAYVGAIGETFYKENRDALNHATIKSFKKYGYDVIAIKDTGRLPFSDGSVRCFSKVMARVQ